MGIVNKVIARLEEFLSRRWFNPFATLWLNFRCMPASWAIKLPVWVYGRPTFINLSGSIRFEGPVRPGLVRFNSSHPAAPSFQGLQSEFAILGEIVFHGYGQIDTGVKLFVGRGARLDLGRGFKICDMVNIGCHKLIEVGEMSWIVHRCQVMDTNYHFVADFNKGVIPSVKKPVRIGRNCWICNSSSIMGGAIIPDFTIVGSNSLVSRDMSAIKPYTLIAGVPAKPIITGLRKVEDLDFTMRLYRHYAEGEKPFPIPDNIDESVFLNERTSSRFD